MRQILLIGVDRDVVGLIAQLLAKMQCAHEFAAGHADALRRLRLRSFDVVITDPVTSVDEDLALIEEMRRIRPGIKIIILSSHNAPEDS